MCAKDRIPVNAPEQDEHRLLLEHYLAFELEAALRRTGAESLAALRGAGAFLASALAGFAAREERGPGDECSRDAAAFEHGFLRMELDAYLRELGELEAAERTGSALSACRRRLLRRVHRLEAVLHLHVDAAADRAGG